MTSVRKLRPNPDIDQLKRQAKELLDAYRGGEPDAIAEVNTHYRGADRPDFALHHAQLVIARSYGFDSWPRLKAYVDGVNLKRLVEHVRAGDLEAAEALLSARPELVNQTVSYGDEHRPIHFAVMDRSQTMVRLLMRHGANARCGIHPHRNATTAITIAEERGYDEIVDIIREEEGRHKPEPPADTPAPRPQTKGLPGDLVAAVVQGNSDWLRTRHAAGRLSNPVTWESGGLLTLAVRHDQPVILQLLLDFGFDPNERVTSGEGDSFAVSQGQPLWQAAALGRTDLAEILLRAGADPNAVVDSSGSSVYSAYSHRQWAMAEFLLQHGGVVGADTAAIYRQADLARKMIEDHDRGTLAPGTVSPGRTLAEDLLEFAASGGADEIVQMALARIDWPRDDPRWFRYLTRCLDFWNHITWLYAANQELDRETYVLCLRQVLERADPNVVGGFQRTVLHEAASLGEHVTEEEAGACAEAILKAGARTDARDQILKSTPLGWACRWGRTSVVRALLAAGADPVELNAEPWARPRAWAEKMGHAHLVELLEQYGA